MRLFVLIMFAACLLTGSAAARTVLSVDMTTTITPANSIQATANDAYASFDWNGRDVTITLACGVYFQNFIISGKAVGQYGTSTFTITGADLTNPTCVVIFANNVDACVVTNHAVVTLVGIQCQTSGVNSNSFLCTNYALCTMSFLGVGVSGNYHLAEQNGARIFYKTTTPGFNGGRTKFYVTGNAAAALYVTNPGSDLLFESVDVIISSGLSFQYNGNITGSGYFAIFAVNSYQHMVNVTYTYSPNASGIIVPLAAQKFRAYDHASYSDGSGSLASIANLPGTGYTIFGCATYNSIPFCAAP